MSGWEKVKVKRQNARKVDRVGDFEHGDVLLPRWYSSLPAHACETIVVIT